MVAVVVQLQTVLQVLLVHLAAAVDAAEAMLQAALHYTELKVKQVVMDKFR
jgi:hypothetical protein